jgi:hypothetical protein
LTFSLRYFPEIRPVFVDFLLSAIIKVKTNFLKISLDEVPKTTLSRENGM